MRPCIHALALLAVTVALASCGGSEANDGNGTVTLRVTRDFGRELLLSEERAPLPDRATVLRVLREHADVELGFRGYGIEAIDGLRYSDGVDGSRETTWALNVNGIEADVPPREYPLHPGDVVQFDLRYWYVTLDVRATVGAYPQTFTRGAFGRRFPVKVECANPRTTACRLVEQAMRRASVATDGSRPPGPRPRRGTVRRARILVGPWKRWRDRPWPHRIDEGTRYSGVFARFADEGDALRLLSRYAHVVRSAATGTGLVGAMRPTEEDLLWLVTGVDDEGVEHAARALNPDDLRDAFAVVASGEGVERIPVPPR